MRALWVLLVVAPMAAGAITCQQDVAVSLGAQPPFATLRGGDVGTTTLGPEATTASIRVSDTAILLANDVLDISSTDAGWKVQAEYVSHTGFTGSITWLTLWLRDGSSTERQIRISSGGVTQFVGSLIDLPSSDGTELLAAASELAYGTLVLELVFTPATGLGPTLHYPVTITVT